MEAFAIILLIISCLSTFLNVELWKTAKELKVEVEHYKELNDYTDELLTQSGDINDGELGTNY